MRAIVKAFHTPPDFMSRLLYSIASLIFCSFSHAAYFEVRAVGWLSAFLARPVISMMLLKPYIPRRLHFRGKRRGSPMLSSFHVYIFSKTFRQASIHHLRKYGYGASALHFSNNDRYDISTYMPPRLHGALVIGLPGPPASQE